MSVNFFGITPGLNLPFRTFQNKSQMSKRMLNKYPWFYGDLKIVKACALSFPVLGLGSCYGINGMNSLTDENVSEILCL